MKKNKQVKPEMEILDKRVSEQMRNGFKINSNTYYLGTLIDDVNSGKIHDAPYQREKVWDMFKKKALAETAMRHGGKKIPPITLRLLPDGTYEVLDGKQRVTSLKSFVENDFALNGIYIPEFAGYKLCDIEKACPMTYGAFMNTEIPVQVISDMTDEEAVVYFIQVNSSGVQMNCGEKIHAMQGTYALKTIESLKQHKIWNYITYVKRHNNYEYIARMLLHVIDVNTHNIIEGDITRDRIITRLDVYSASEVPHSAYITVKKTLDLLYKILKKYNFKLTIRELYNVFIYTNKYLNVLNVSDFGKFLKELYYFIHEKMDSESVDLFYIIKTKHLEPKFMYTAKYYEWYINTLNSAYTKFVQGVDWDEISKLSLNK